MKASVGSNPTLSVGELRIGVHWYPEFILKISNSALDEWTDLDVPMLLGAVNTGDMWWFGVFDSR
ncbi:MAG: hypothetical protein QNJ47_14585 [Nostocaceae cyanobacterium]|nr:hypothetical protein [Nostocaceae cyanobacterium]